MTNERNKSALSTKMSLIISRIILRLMLASLETNITVAYHYFTSDCRIIAKYMNRGKQPDLCPAD